MREFVTREEFEKLRRRVELIETVLFGWDRPPKVIQEQFGDVLTELSKKFETIKKEFERLGLWG
ncbi:MAG: hypothetical protein QW687_01635 [Candidatus Hadarchaeales archaeon]